VALLMMVAMEDKTSSVDGMTLVSGRMPPVH